MSRKTDSRTNQGDLDAQIAGVMMAFACDGPNVVGTQPTWYTLPVADYMDGWRWPNGWVPGPLIQAGIVCDKSRRIARRLAWLCDNKLLERDAGRYCPPAVALTFRRPRDGVEILSQLSRTEWRRKRRAVAGSCVVAVLGRQSWRYYWELSYVGILPGEGSPADLKDCASLILLDDDWLTDRPITTFRLTESGERWARDPLGHNLDSGNDAAPAATTDGDAPGQSPEPTPDAGADGADAVAAVAKKQTAEGQHKPNQMPPRALAVHTQWQKAVQAMDGEKPTQRQIYTAVARQAEMDGTEVLTFATWTKYLRIANQCERDRAESCLKHNTKPRASVVGYKQIEPKHLPTRIKSDSQTD